jgi:hypothetical protein
MGEWGGALRVLVGKLREGDHLEDSGTDESIIKLLKICAGMVDTGLN